MPSGCLVLNHTDLEKESNLSYPLFVCRKLRYDVTLYYSSHGKHVDDVSEILDQRKNGLLKRMKMENSPVFVSCIHDKSSGKALYEISDTIVSLDSDIIFLINDNTKQNQQLSKEYRHLLKHCCLDSPVLCCPRLHRPRLSKLLFIYTGYCKEDFRQQPLGPLLNFCESLQLHITFLQISSTKKRSSGSWLSALEDWAGVHQHRPSTAPTYSKFTESLVIQMRPEAKRDETTADRLDFYPNIKYVKRFSLDNKDFLMDLNKYVLDHNIDIMAFDQRKNGVFDALDKHHFKYVNTIPLLCFSGLLVDPDAK